MENIELIHAYKKTLYHIPSKNLILKIDKPNLDLDIFLNANKKVSYAFITAHNPMSVILSDNENETRHNEFIQMVRLAGYVYFEGYGSGTEGWKDEKSLLILGISKEKAISDFGIYFKQKAIVFGDVLKAPELLMLDNFYK